MSDGTFQLTGQFSFSFARTSLPFEPTHQSSTKDDVDLDTLDILAETLSRFGAGFPADTFRSIQAGLIPLLSHSRAAVRKRTSAAIGQLVVHEPDELFDQLVGQVVGEAADRASKKDKDKLKSYVGCLAVLR
jgi:cullin-associated NEDD8-dissociated protein 1